MSHSNYTPNYGSAREMYAYGADSFHGTDSRPENRAEFDRFINKVKADAWAEGYETGCSSPTERPRRRASRMTLNPTRTESRSNQ